MSKYGQYCPVAMAMEILGDRWTLLVVRDLLGGERHFNDLERGLPGISRGLLTERLRRLEAEGVVRKRSLGPGRKTIYTLTDAGLDLKAVVHALTSWGAHWAFGEPTDDQLDPLLLMWWMKDRVHMDRLPDRRIVVQFDFWHEKKETYWLVLTREDVSVCLTDPGYAINVLVEADLKEFFQVWLGRMRLPDAMARGSVRVEAIPAHRRRFPGWFKWSPAAPAVRAATDIKDR